MHISATRPLVLGLIVTALAGCGGGGSKATTPTPSASATATTSGAAAGGGEKLALAADKSRLKFNKSALSAKPGKVTIAMTNPSALQHNVAIEGNGVTAKGKIVGQGGTSTVTANVKAGTYTFFCSVDGHRQAGMEGKLTVK
jgi:plastocyanin